MKKMASLVALLVLAIVLLSAVYAMASKDLMRKEAERLFLAAFPGASNESQYIFLPIGVWGAFPAPMSTTEKNIFIKLQRLGLLNFNEKDKGWNGKEYSTEITEKGKSEITDTKGFDISRLPDFKQAKWYKIRMFNAKFIRCTGIRNFNEKKEAIADFSVEFMDRTKTFSAISDELKKFLSVRWLEPPIFKIFLRWDWLQKTIDDSSFKGTLSITFDLYDDGWRLRKPKS